jgi:hypothetical protein
VGFLPDGHDEPANQERPCRDEHAESYTGLLGEGGATCNPRSDNARRRSRNAACRMQLAFTAPEIANGLAYAGAVPAGAKGAAPVSRNVPDLGYIHVLLPQR